MPALVQNAQTQIASVPNTDAEHVKLKVAFKKQVYFTKLHNTIIWSSDETP